MLSFCYPNKMLVFDEHCGRRSFLPPCSDGGGAPRRQDILAIVLNVDVITHLRTRLTLGSGNKGGEAQRKSVWNKQ
jgi:hypothetical protein